MIHKGNIRPEGAPTISFSPRAGRKKEKSQKFLISEFETTYEPQLQLAGYRYTWEPIAGTPHGWAKWVEPLTEPSSDTWSVRYNETQQSLWLDEEVQAEMMRVFTDPAGRAKFRGDVDAAVRGERTYTDDDGTSKVLNLTSVTDTAKAAGFDADTLDKLVADLSAGVEFRIVSTPVLTRSLILPEDASLAEFFENTGFLFKKYQLIRDHPTIPDQVIEVIPDSEDGAGDAVGTGFWLKKQPEAIQQDDGPWKVDCEFWYAERIARMLEKYVVA